MDIVNRARSIIVNPKPTWAIIEQEDTDWQKLYVPYMVVLAAIPAVAGFIGWSVFGVSGFGMSMRIPVITGLGMMLSQYIMTLVMMFVWGWLISMLAGVFSAIPGLSVLVMVGGLYSLYLIYLGLPQLMKNPQEKSLPYLAVAAVVGIVCGVLISVFSSALMPSPMSRLQGGGDINITTPKGDVQISASPIKSGASGDAAMTIKTADGEVKIDMKNMEELAKRMQALAAQNEAKK